MATQNQGETGMLRSKELFVKSCKRCEKTFRTDKEGAKVCPVCQEKALKEYQKKYREEHKDKAKEHRERYKSLKKEKFHRTVPNTTPIRELTAIIEKYNIQHGTRYTYGQFVSLVHNKKIEL